MDSALVLYDPLPVSLSLTLSRSQSQMRVHVFSQFFTLVVTLNLVGIALAATEQFPYANNHTGALLLGNLLCAVMMRNELFMRILYALTNALLAKVSKFVTLDL